MVRFGWLVALAALGRAAPERAASRLPVVRAASLEKQAPRRPLPAVSEAQPLAARARRVVDRNNATANLTARAAARPDATAGWWARAGEPPPLSEVAAGFGGVGDEAAGLQLLDNLPTDHAVQRDLHRRLARGALGPEDETAEGLLAAAGAWGEGGGARSLDGP